jgi:hypothetical protein
MDNHPTVTNVGTGSPRGESEEERGREAAALLWRHWRDRPEIDDPRTPAFAAGALDQLVDLQHRSADVDKEMRFYAEAAAEQLTADPFHGILEILQNADDLGARSLWLAVKKGKVNELLAVHDGHPVFLPDVIALTLAFLSTKRQDSRAKGRFGIGLKTLNQIGGPLQVHSPPYHFQVDRGTIARAAPAAGLKGMYDRRNQRTLLRLKLDPDTDPDELRAWIETLDTRQLIFLDSVRAVHLVDPQTGRSRKSIRVTIRPRPPIDLVLRPGVGTRAERTLIREPGSRGRSWERYSIEYPVPADKRRAHKQTGDTTPLAVAVPSTSSDAVLAAGLPLGISNSLPISLNAQFDPESGRRSITHRVWNVWLLERLADLVGAVAVSRFAEDPRGGWQVVPLLEEADAEDSWLDAQLVALATAVQTRVEKSVRLAGAGFDALVYEAPSLERVLSESDLAHLGDGLTPVKRAWRDSGGRWRRVLGEVGDAEVIDAAAALELLEDEHLMADRPTRWFVRLVDAALAEGLEAKLLEARCVLTADGQRLAPGGGVLLVRRMDKRGLAARLGLAQPIAAEFIGRGAPTRVKAWLGRARLLAEVPDAHGALLALSRLAEDAPADLDDETLKLVRDALDEVDDTGRGILGARIGKRVRIHGFHWVDGKRERLRIVPGKSYLPTAISKETRGWAKAAATTPGLQWVDSRYLSVLRTAGREEAGARRFFVALGAEVVPRLVAVGALSSPVPIAGDVPVFQNEALARARHATHFARDWRSPDLDTVVTDIARQRVDRKRRARARALFETITQHWDRLSNTVEARTAWFYYTWREDAQVPATWMARLASEPWLSNKKGRRAAPLGLAIDTPLTRLTRGADSAQYVAELTEADAGAPFVAALGVKGSAPASELLRELASLRDRHGPEVTADDVRPHYLALAALCRRSGAQDEVGDITITELRCSFGVGSGLILTESGWKTPKDVRLGRAVFGVRRSFVPESSPLAPLWRALGIQRPSTDDCLEVLEEIAATDEEPTAEDRAVIVDTLRYLADQELAPRRARGKIGRFPLWTSSGWIRSTEAIAVDDRALETTLGQHIPVWLPGCSLRTLKTVPEARGVSVVPESAFVVTSSTAAEASEAAEITTYLFRAALGHFSSKLAESEPALWSRGDWAAMNQLELFEVDDLLVTVRLGRKSIAIPRDVHLEGRERVYFRTEDDLGEPELGGRAVASFFPRDAGEVVPYAWSYAWRRADAEGPPAAPLNLAQESTERDDLEDLARNAAKAKGQRLFGGGAVNGKAKRKQTTKPRPAPRLLKDFSSATIGDLSIEGGPAQSPKRPTKRRKLIDPPARPPGPPAGGRALHDWTDQEKESRGFEVLAAALKTLDGVELGDFRALRNIGADSIDNLRRYFEMKAHLGAVPDEITLEPTEFQRAATVDGTGAYYLAVVGGLEEGTDTIIRIFAHPLRTLRWKRTTTLRLAGVRTARALVIPIQDG